MLEELSALLLCFMIAHSHDDDVLCYTYVVAFRMCKGWKIVLLFREKRYLPLAAFGAQKCVRNCKILKILSRDFPEFSLLNGIYG